MKVDDVLNKENKTTKIHIKADKKKKNNPTPSESNPYANDVDVHNGMTEPDGVDGVINP